MRALIALLVIAGLAGCSIVYRLPTRQGNVLEQKDLDQLQVGMTREQVKFLMGTPVAASPFRTDRWDYTGYYKSPRGKIYSRTVTLFFDGDKLARMDGVKLAEGQTTDPAAIDAFDAKDKSNTDRPIDQANPKQAPPVPAPTQTQ